MAYRVSNAGSRIDLMTCTLVKCKNLYGWRTPCGMLKKFLSIFDGSSRGLHLFVHRRTSPITVQTAPENRFEQQGVNNWNLSGFQNFYAESECLAYREAFRFQPIIVRIWVGTICNWSLKSIFGFIVERLKLSLISEYFHWPLFNDSDLLWNIFCTV